MSCSKSKGVSNIGEAEEQHQQLHVLAVEDCDIQRKVIEGLLKSSSYKVTTAENGLRALEYLGLSDAQQSKIFTKDERVNLIITDYCMPGMTGFELMKKVKESRNFKEVPVVIMSSDNDPTRIEKCLEEGAQEYMLKPLRKSDVKRLKCHMLKFEGPNNGRLCLGS